jgi:hypothetical protein
MCTSQQPLTWADSEWNPRPFRVLMCDRYEPDIRFEVRIPRAIGPNDARNQARELYPSASPLREWEAV